MATPLLATNLCISADSIAPEGLAFVRPTPRESMSTPLQSAPKRREMACLCLRHLS